MRRTFRRLYMFALGAALCRSGLAATIGTDTASHLRFYVPFDGDVKAAVYASFQDPVTAEGAITYEPGISGQAVRVVKDKTKLAWSGLGHMRQEEGSISLWVKPDWELWTNNLSCMYEDGVTIFWAQRVASEGGTFRVWYTTGGHMYDRVWSWDYGASPARFGPPSGAGDGGWRHIVVTWKQFSKKRSLKRMYLDGALIYSGEVKTAMPAIDDFNQIRIGRKIGDCYWAPGLYDELACWDKALGADEVALLHEGKLHEAMVERARAQKPLPKAPQPHVRIERGTVDRGDYLYFDGEPVLIQTALESGPAVSGRAAITLDVVNLYGQVVHHVVTGKTMAANRRFEMEWVFPPGERGIFKAVASCEVNGKTDRKDVVTFGVVGRRAYDSGFDPGSPFAGHAFATRADLDRARKLGVKWIRGLDLIQITWWNSVEPNKGTFVWRDDALRNITEAKLNFMGVLYQPPAWAWKVFPETSLEDWRGYVFETVKHCKGVVKHWEIWNEPNSSTFNQKPERYAELLKVAYEAAKQADPECKVVGIGGVHLTGYVPWVEKVFQAGGLQYMDIMSFHGYGSVYDKPVPVEGFQNGVEQIQTLMKKYGRTVPLWCSESGCIGWTFFSDLNEDDIKELLPKPFRSTPNYRFSCNNLVYNYVTMLANGVDRWFYYSFAPMSGLSAENHGYMYEYNGAPKPHALAYAALADRLTGKSYRAAPEKGHYVKVYVFSGETGNTAVIFGRYLNGRTLQLALPQGRPAFTAYNIMGNQVRLPEEGATIPLTEEPVYLEAAAGDAGLRMLMSSLEAAKVGGLEGLEEEWQRKLKAEEGE